MASGTEIFRLFGSIFIDSSQAEASLSKTEEKAEETQNTFAKTVSSAAKWATGTAAAITAATVAIFKVADSVASVGDEIDKQSQKLGISAQAYQEWDAILGHCGASMDRLKEGMKTLSKAIADGSADQVAAFEKVGLSLDEVKQMSTEDVFAAVITGLQGMEEGADRTNTATALLGESAQELGPLLNTTAEATEKMRQTVNDLGGVMSDDAVAASAEFKDALQDLQTVAGWFKREFVANIIPYVTAGMQGLTTALTTTKNAVTDLKNGFVSFGNTAVNAISRASFAFSKFIGDTPFNSYEELQAALQAQKDDAISKKNRDDRHKDAQAGKGIYNESWTEREAKAAAAAATTTTSGSTGSSGKSSSSSSSSAASAAKKTAQIIDSLTQKSEQVANGITTAIQTVRNKYDDGTEHITRTVTESGTEIVDGVARNYKTVTTYLDDVQQKVEKTVEDINTSVSAVQTQIDKNLSEAKSQWKSGILGTFQDIVSDLKSGNWKGLGVSFAKLIWGEISTEQREIISKWAVDALTAINESYSGGGAKAAYESIKSLFTNGISEGVTEAGTAIQSFNTLLDGLGKSGGAGAKIASVATSVQSMATSVVGSLGGIVSFVAANPILALVLGIAGVAGGIGIASWLKKKKSAKQEADTSGTSSALSYKDIQDAYWYGSQRSFAGYDFRTDGYAFGESPANGRLSSYQQKMRQSVDALYNVVQQYLPAVAEKRPIVLDGGAVVGELAPAMNEQLGYLGELSERGN